jgi:hypothetical protein
MKLLVKLRPGLSHLFVGLLLVSVILSCQKELKFDKKPGSHNLVLRFKPIIQYDTNTMILGQSYLNFFNEEFTPTAFKFYIHGVELINEDSNKVFRIPSGQHFLIDFADSTSTEVKVSILPYTYNKMEFVVGVDSASNVAPTPPTGGSLDPANGMYWDATRGYIMAKLEGTSSSSSESGGKFAFHIGGFTGANNVLRPIALYFPFGQLLDLKPGQTTVLEITVDAFDWFYNPHDIRLNTNPIITSEGLLATRVAENYTKMFTLDTVLNNQ